MSKVPLSDRSELRFISMRFFHIFPWVVQWVIYFSCSWVKNVLLFLQSCKHRTFHLYAFSWCGDNNSEALPESETSHNHFSFAIVAGYLDVSADLRFDTAIFSTLFAFVPLCLPELINVMFDRHARFLVEIGSRISTSSFSVASLAASFARSLSTIPVCPGIHTMLMLLMLFCWSS